MTTKFLFALLVSLPLCSAQTFSVPWIYGPNKVYRGRGSGYVQIHVQFAGAGAHVYWQSLSGLPAGVTAEYLCADTRAVYKNVTGTYCWVSATATQTEMFLRLIAEPNAILGTTRATVVLKSAGTEVPVTIPIQVVDPAPVPPEPALQQVPLPAAALATWEKWMENPGYNYCAAGGAINVPYEGDIWYYDGGYGYFGISDHKGDPAKWKPCAFWVVNAWRDYLNKLGYLNAGWRTFLPGLYRAWQETGDPSYAQAIEIQANKSPSEVYLGPIARKWNTNGFWINGSREMLYRVHAYVYLEKTGGARVDEINEHRPKIFVAADRAIFTLDRMLYSPYNVQTEFQSWIYGIGMRTLIDYYEHTKNEPQGPDTRVLNVVRDGVTWAYYHRDASGAVLHSPWQSGPLCTYSCGQYVALNNAFLAPAAAWLWRKTGDDFFRQVADELFMGLTNWNVETRKQWSQTMWWMHEYFRWRTEGLLDPAQH